MDNVLAEFLRPDESKNNSLSAARVYTDAMADAWYLDSACLMHIFHEYVKQIPDTIENVGPQQFIDFVHSVTTESPWINASRRNMTVMSGALLRFSPLYIRSDVQWLAEFDDLISLGNCGGGYISQIPSDVCDEIWSNPDYLASIRCPIKPAKLDKEKLKFSISKKCGQMNV